jgi:hypothetical protein
VAIRLYEDGSHGATVPYMETLATCEPSPEKATLNAGYDLYYHLHDEDSQRAMEALAESTPAGASDERANSPSEGNLRAMGQSKIEKTLQVPVVQELVTSLANITERAGFEPALSATAYKTSI